MSAVLRERGIEVSTIKLYLLGSTDVGGIDERSARAVLVQSKCVATLAYLALAGRSMLHRRDRLAGLLWPELDQEHARAQVRRVVHTLRHALGDAAIAARGDEIGLAPGAVWCDAVAVDEAVGAGHYQRALELYRRGELLPSFYVPQAQEFDDWLARERTALRDRAAAAAWGLAAHCAEGGQHTIAVESAKQAALLASTDERMLRRVIALLHRLGDRAAVLHLYDEFARRLRRDFDAAPAAETRALVADIRAAP